MYVFIKILVSAFIIGIVTEVARRFPTYGGVIAALPLVSLLSVTWLYIQGEQASTINKFVLGVLWGFPATVVLLLIVYFSLKNSISLFISVGLGIIGWGIFLFFQDVIIRMVKSSCLF